MLQFKLLASQKFPFYSYNLQTRGVHAPLYMGGHGFGILHQASPEIAKKIREFQTQTENTQWETYLTLLTSVKSLFKTIFKIPQTHEIAFDSNTTAFHNKIIPSIHRTKKPVLMIDTEFHALWRTLIRLKEKERIKKISLFKYEDGEKFTKRLKRKLKRTSAKTLLISHVQSNRQTFFDLTTILKTTKEKKIHVILDVTQSLGNVLHDLSNVCHPHVTLLCSGIKYLHCGENLGLCIFPKKTYNFSDSTGWFSNPHILTKAACSQKSTKFTPGLQFNGGTPGNIHALSLAYVTLKQFQIPEYSLLNQHRYILDCQKQVLDALDSSQTKLFNRQNLHNKINEKEDRSNTLVFDMKKIPLSTEIITHYLSTQGLIVDQRENRYIRIGFQPNLTHVDIQFLIETLRKIPHKSCLETQGHIPSHKVTLLNQLDTFIHTEK